MESNRKVLTVYSILIVYNLKRLNIPISNRLEAKKRYTLLIYVDKRIFIRLN